MPSNVTVLSDRFNEVVAIASVRAVLDQLETAAREPSTKRFTRSRERASELWYDIVQVAQSRANLPVPVARTRKARATPKSATPVDNGASTTSA